MTAICSFNQAFASGTVIYGQDDRKDLYEVVNPLHKQWAAATVALVKKSDIQQNASGVMEVKADTFMDLMGVCSTERFADQPSGGFCSGSLIGPNLILTAGHCVQNMSDCADTSFVFDYAVNVAGRYPSEVADSAVYNCKSVIHSQMVGSGADFAIVETDRAITGRTPLKLNRARLQNEITNGTKLVMIGHPAGLPTKVDDGAKVRNGAPTGYFVATTDSYGGNSGSAVLNYDTGEVEGVLVRGEQDYVWNNGCYVSNVCAEDGCSGEDVTKVSSVLPYLN
jgi:V8-like Glu-specific endopeptidase